MIRTDLHLTYVQIGVLFSVPAIAGHLVEPALGILGDVWDRRALLLGGGVVLAASMVLIAATMKAVRSRSVLRWLVLLELSDLMLDGLHGYLALYFVDVAETSAAQAAVGVVIWTGFGLLGGLMLIPLLERIRGLTYLRVSAVANLFVQ